MIKASLVAEKHPQWSNNKFFSGDPSFGFKTDIYHFAILKEKLLNLGVDLSTDDINKTEDSSLIICFDQAEAHLPQVPGQVKYLIIHDTFVYSYANWLIINHTHFDKIFVWNEDLVDHKKYFHYNIPFIFDYPIPELISKETYQQRTLCVMVSTEGSVNNYESKYSLAFERYKIVHWFAENHPQDFQIFGRGWKERFKTFRGYFRLKKIFPSKVLSAISNITAKKDKLFKLYGGELGPLDKLNKISEFNFYLCYENSKIKSWITEKIFECFAASCVPIYLGAENITDYIPAGCFIDRRAFKSDEELYQFLKNISFEDYTVYLKNIIDFYNSEAIHKFKIECFVDNILKHIKEDLHISN